VTFLDHLIDALIVVAALGSSVAWVVALASAIAMARHRAPGVTLLYLATHGIAFFDDRFFTAAAVPHRRRLGRAFVVFFGFVFLGMALGVLAARRAAPN